MTRRSIAPFTIVAFALLVTTLVPAIAGDYYDIILANRLVGRLRDPGPYGSVSARASCWRVSSSVTPAWRISAASSGRRWCMSPSTIWRRAGR